MIILLLSYTLLPQPKAQFLVICCFWPYSFGDPSLLNNFQLQLPEHWGQEHWSFPGGSFPFFLTLDPSAIHFGCGYTSGGKSLVSLWTTHTEALPSLPSCLCWPAWLPLIHSPKQPVNCPSFQKCKAHDLIPSAPNFQWPLIMFRIKFVFMLFSVTPAYLSELSLCTFCPLHSLSSSFMSLGIPYGSQVYKCHLLVETFSQHPS